MAGAIIFGRVGVSFSWQVQLFVKFWEMAGARNVVLFYTKNASQVSRAAGAR